MEKGLKVVNVLEIMLVFLKKNKYNIARKGDGVQEKREKEKVRKYKCRECMCLAVGEKYWLYIKKKSWYV